MAPGRRSLIRHPTARSPSARRRVRRFDGCPGYLPRCMLGCGPSARFAHGRLWSTLTILPREVVERSATGDVQLRVTNSLDRLIWAAWPALDVINLGLHLHRGRATSLLPRR